jgi:hypothetical protein
VVSPHKSRLVVSHSTCPPLSSSPPPHSFVLGTAVINTTQHCEGNGACTPLSVVGDTVGLQLRAVCCLGLIVAFPGTRKSCSSSASPVGGGRALAADDRQSSDTPVLFSSFSPCTSFGNVTSQTRSNANVQPRNRPGAGRGKGIGLTLRTGHRNDDPRSSIMGHLWKQ